MKINESKNVKKIVKYIGGIIELPNKDYNSVTLGERKSMKAPKWFTTWSTEFEKKNDSRWDEQMKFNGNVSKFIENQMDFNSKIMLRLDNIVSKNNLTE